MAAPDTLIKTDVKETVVIIPNLRYDNLACASQTKSVSCGTYITITLP